MRFRNINSSLKRLPGLVAAVAVSMSFAGAAYAQNEDNDDQGYGLEEITITATKRTSSLQDVGVAVTAFTGDSIARANLANSTELLTRVSNLDIVGGTSGSTNANVFIRGVGSTGVSFNLQSGVGFYSDEVVLNSPVVNVLQLYDLERVEVIRGPQNTLYGRNTTGGAVNYISRKPEVGGDANGYVNIAYGRFNQLNVEAAVGAPIGDNVAIRASIQTQSRDGIRINSVDGNRVHSRENYAGRLQLAWEPSDTVSVLLKAHAERVRDDNQRMHPIGGPGCPTPNRIGTCATNGGFLGSDNPRIVANDMLNSPVEVDSGGALANVTVDFETFTFTSITGYEENNQFLTEDTDATPSPGFHFQLTSEQDQFSQEFRLASDGESDLKWILGAYYFRENMTGQTGPMFGTPMGIMLVQSIGDFNNTAWSGYGELEYDVNEKLTLKGGFRLGYDQIKGRSAALLAFGQAIGFDLTNNLLNGTQLPDFATLEAAAVNAGIPTFTGGDANPVGGGPFRLIRVGGPTDPGAQINDTSWTEWGATAGFDYKATDDVLIYAKWSRGFKSGRFNAAAMSIMDLDTTTGRSVGDTPINPEIVNAYEVGAKTEFLDGRARLNVSAFYNDYQDQQINQFIDGEFSVVNADSEIIGAEIEFNVTPTEGLFLDLSMGLMDTTVKNPTNSALLGDELPFAANFSSRGSIRYDHVLTNENILSFEIDGQYMSDRFFNLANSAEGAGFFVSNAQISYQFGDDHQFRLSLWGKNIFDELYFLNRVPGGTGSGADTVLLSEPSSYGITVRADF